MPLQQLVGADGLINWAAAAEQMAFNRYLYNGDAGGLSDLVRQVMADAVVLAQGARPANMVARAESAPAWVLFSHNGQLWLVIEGTATAGQWYANVFGSLVTGTLRQNNGTFQGDWANFATKIWDAVARVQGSYSTARLNVSGHSLGGAVAWMVAALAKQVSTRRVDVMTFGSPRPEAGAYSGSLPDYALDVQTKDDPVIYLPPNLFPGSSTAWRQQGSRYVIDTDGTVLPNSTNDGEASPRALYGAGFVRHLPSTYTRALIDRYLAGTRIDFTTRLLHAAGYLDNSWIDRPASPLPLPNGTTAQPGGPPTPVPDATLESLDTTPNQPPRFLMAASAFKVTFHYNCGQNGWSEQYYWASGSSGYADCLADAVLLHNARMGFSPPAVVPAGISFSELPLGVDGQTFSATDIRPTSFTEWDTTDMILAGVQSDTYDNPYSTLFFRAFSPARTASRLIKIKGVAAIFLPGTDKNLFNKSASAIAVATTANYIAQLLGKRPSKAYTNKGVWSLTSRVYRRNKQSQIGIDAIDILPYRNRTLYEITATGLAAKPGMRLHVGGVRGNGTAGINGDTTALVVGTVGAVQQITLNRGPRCGGDILPISFGHVSLINGRVLGIDSVSLMKTGDSKVGLPHGGTRGRRSAPRC